jgi:hypothetical protein
VVGDDRATSHPSPTPAARLLRACWDRRGDVLLLAAGLLIAALVYQLYGHESGRFSPQSMANIRFARSPDFASALQDYRRLWPPLYASTLWTFAQSGLHIRWLNLVLLYLVLIGVWKTVRLTAPRVQAALPVALYALCHFNYVTLHQYVSEGLFVLLALLCLVQTLRYSGSSSAANLVGLAALSSAACLTRYIGLFWLVPIAGAQIAFASLRSARQRAAHLGGFLFITLLPAGLWMWDAYRRTGNLTGMDRFEPRAFPRRTDLDFNLFYTVKTLLIDFFSPQRNASHSVVNQKGSLLPAEMVIIGVAGLVALGLVAASLRARSNRGRIDAAPVSGAGRWQVVASALSSEHSLIWQFSLGYLLVVIVLWTIGNNDPIHTRFLYPCYLFLVLSFVCAYSRIKGHLTERRVLLPFWALYLLIVAVQSYNSLSPLVGGG